MQYDYYAFRAEKTFKINERDEQEHIEPHLPYLWYEALNRDLKNSVRDAWQTLTTDQNSKLAKQIQSIKKEQDAFGFTPNLSALDRLPSLSFMLHIPFKLRKPYLSKDDRVFHLLDNPVRKDKVFQTPMVASTSWKGALRAALWQLKSQEEIKIADQDIERLFGNKRGEENHEKLKSGRLYFYPTFFDKIGLEVINPHNRKTGTGKNPILIESVPIGATGELVILYVPFGKVDEGEVAEDLKLVAKGVQAMLMVYGFGEKTSSGFGVVEQQAIGQIAINYPDVPETPPHPQEPTYPENLQRFLEQHPDEDFRLKPDAWRKLNNASQPQRKSYQEARNARSDYQRNLATYQSDLANWEAQGNTPPLPKTERNFNALDQLVTKAKELEQQLIGGESNA